MSGFEPTLKPKTGVVRRLEVLSGDLGRRRWPDEVKAQIVLESFAPGAVVSAVARRHGLTPQQVFTWRRRARRGDLVLPVPDGPASVPVVPARWMRPPSVARRRQRTWGSSRSRSAARSCGSAPTGEQLTKVLLAVKAAG